MKEKLTNLLMGLYTKPSYVDESIIEYELTDNGVCISLFGGYRISIAEDLFECAYGVPEGCALGYFDLEYGLDIMKHRKEIMEIVKEWREIAKGLDKEEVVKVDENTGLNYYSK